VSNLGVAIARNGTDGLRLPVARAGLVVAGIAGVVSARDTERSPQSYTGRLHVAMLATSMCCAWRNGRR